MPKGIYKRKSCMMTGKYKRMFWMKTGKNSNHEGKNNTFYGKHHSDKTKRLLSKQRLGVSNPDVSKALKGRSRPDISKALKSKWKNDRQFAERMLKIQMIGQNKVRNKPNKPEKLVMMICRKIKIKVRFVGNGKLIIGAMNPDIKIVSQKKVIEVFGNYWHQGHHPNSRIRKLSKYGWKCLVIWQSELRNIEKIKKKIIRFYNV